MILGISPVIDVIVFVIVRATSGPGMNKMTVPEMTRWQLERDKKYRSQQRWERREFWQFVQLGGVICLPLPWKLQFLFPRTIESIFSSQVHISLLGQFAPFKVLRVGFFF